MLQRLGASLRTRISWRDNRNLRWWTSSTTWPSPDSSRIGDHAPRRITSATLSMQRAQPSVSIGGDHYMKFYLIPEKDLFPAAKFKRSTAIKALKQHALTVLPRSL